MHDKTTDLLAKYRKNHKDMMAYKSIRVSIDKMLDSAKVFECSLLEPDTRIVYWFSE